MIFGCGSRLCSSAQHLLAAQAIAADDLVHEATISGRFRSKPGGVGAAGVAQRAGWRRAQCEQQQEAMTAVQLSLYELMSFRCEYSAIRIPNPARRVTTEVPP